MTSWPGVFARDRMGRGVAPGIAQIGHGKKSGLPRMRAPDGLGYGCIGRSTGSRSAVPPRR